MVNIRRRCSWHVKIIWGKGQVLNPNIQVVAIENGFDYRCNKCGVEGRVVWMRDEKGVLSGVSHATIEEVNNTAALIFI